MQEFSYKITVALHADDMFNFLKTTSGPILQKV